MKTILGIALNLVLLTAPLMAQDFQTYDGPKTVIALPTTYDGIGPVTRTRAARLSGLGPTDFVALDGPAAVAILAPDVMNATLLLADDVLDFDVLPKSGVQGLDTLITARSSGLVEIAYDSTNGSLLETSWIDVTWAGAQSVQYLEREATGAILIVGLSSTRRDILLGKFEHGSLTTTVEYSSPAVIDEFAALDWLGHGDYHYAVLTDEELIVAHEGSAHSSWTTVAGGTILPFRDTGSANDRLIWVRVIPQNGYQELCVLDSAGMEPPIALGTLSVQAMGPAVDNLGYTHLMTSSELTTHEIFLFNQESSPTFTMTPESAVALNLGLLDLNPGQNAVPVCVDVHGDGAPDLALLIENGRRFVIMESPLDKPTPMKPAIMNPRLEFEIESPPYLVLDFDPSSVPSTATDLEIRVWYQEDLTTSLWPDALAYYRAPLTQGAASNVHIPLGQPNPYDTGIYQLTIRYADHANPNEPRFFPPVIQSYTADPDLLDALRNTPNSGVLLVSVLEDPETDGPPKDGGGLVMFPMLPPPPMGSTPSGGGPAQPPPSGD